MTRMNADATKMAMAGGKKRRGAALVWFGMLWCNYLAEKVGCPMVPIRVISVISGLISGAATVALPSKTAGSHGGPLRPNGGNRGWPRWRPRMNADTTKMAMAGGKKPRDGRCYCTKTGAPLNATRLSYMVTGFASRSGSMKIHEYQARSLLSEAGIPVPAARTASSPAEVRAAFKANGAAVQVVKAQVFAGGRGKAGFVKLVKSADEAEAAADFMFKNRMISAQTGPEGIAVEKVLIAAAVDIDKEFYVGVALDRARGVPVLIASREGGVEIETVAHERPEAILREPLHPLLGLEPFKARGLAYALGFSGKPAGVVADIISKLAALFLKYDCTIAEVNPLVLTKDGQIQAIDAKLNFDDNALFRHAEIAAMADPSETDPLEVRAAKANLNYIKLDGTIACLVNGAGLAMATMDVVQLHGGSPANFLDVGGGVKPEGAIEAFRILLSDPKVRGVLVNIFGGIARCDLIAAALLQAGKEVGFRVPVVVRLEGTNVKEAREMLAGAQRDLPTLQTATDLTDAAKKIVAAAGGR